MELAFINSPSLMVVWILTIYGNILISLFLLFYILLTKNRDHFITIEYLVLLFIPVLGVAYTIHRIFKIKKIQKV
ncbi:hypothetical protein SAMN05421761_11945 [Belliella pelovolcani]|uniref:Uncharacterized protein n=1 Tax=Belliella pelovolcani TaxID=529505 RepID=A0A1N7PR72_9BACT|nr:hypothetical protein SAMN05421761_11945 [Belliella pelovolcani]